MVKRILHITAIAGGLALGLMAGALHADSDTVAVQQNLASELGLEYEGEYSYRDWRLEVLEQFQFSIPEIGDCGTWDEPKDCEQNAGYGGLELLYCSHGKDITDNCDMKGEGPFFETVYLTEQDVTLLTKFQNKDDDGHTRVKLLKLAEGRQPDIHES
ncbi:hypothetical protein SAMN04487958_11212 [Vreelandella subterranea]|uniref:Uncharacterized protein n=1 Tax=Vreelandella subterranea TaxID=416874 RepID=A0A1H9W285_9GAMM|nr:hypothetical protein [Halomonas subterranea]SES28036.1 hypothetical protein SAMN04487958_11212 [Halomonas subterranea]